MNQRLLHPVLTALIAVSVLAACGGGSADKLVASAKSYLEQQNPRAAIIELKNALQKTPDSPEVRFLLGRALLDNGEAESAVVELGKALDLKHPDAIVLPVLGRAMIAAGQAKKLVDQHGGKTLADANATAEFRSTLSVANEVIGNRDAAKGHLDAALAAAPDNAAARVIEARLAAGKGDLAAALRMVDAVLARAPANDEALLLRGDVLWRLKGDSAGALEAYRKALATKRNTLSAHSAILEILLDKPQLDKAQTDAAAAQLAELKKAWPQSSQVRWFETRLALARGEFKEALKLSEQLLARAPTDARFLYAGGLANYMAGSQAQAANLFGKLLQASPENGRARIMLARSQLRLNEPAKALVTILPLVEKPDPSADVLTLAGQAHQGVGESAKAQAYFARAAKLDPSDSRARTALALSRLADGDGSAALGELQDIAAADKGSAVDLRIIGALIARKDNDAALQAVERLDKKQPGGAMAPYLRGTILFIKGDTAGARASLERAVAADAKFFPAAARLAALDVDDKKPDQAKARIERVLAADPKNLQATLAMIDLRATSGASKEEVAEQLAAAIKANPGEAVPRLRLIEHSLRFGDTKAALAAARDASATLPDDPQVLVALGTAQRVAGELNQASASFNKLIALQPRSPTAYLRLSEVQVAAKDDAGALASVKKAWAIAPAAPLVQRSLVGRLVAMNRHGEAAEVARSVQKQSPKDALGHLLEADVEAARKNWPAAVAAYRNAHARSKSSYTALTLHVALLNAKLGAEAAKLASEWLAQNPKDVTFLSHLGDASIGDKDYPSAEARFLDVLRIDPAHAVALNNVAWLRSEMKKPGALEFAEKAAQLRPDEAAFLDTLATVLAADKQIDKAIVTQKKAVDLKPDNAALRLQLAQLLLQSGDKASARVELERLAKLGDRFPRQDEVNQLLKTL